MARYYLYVKFLVVIVSLNNFHLPKSVSVSSRMSHLPIFSSASFKLCNVKSFDFFSTMLNMRPHGFGSAAIAGRISPPREQTCASPLQSLEHKREAFKKQLAYLSPMRTIKLLGRITTSFLPMHQKNKTSHEIRCYQLCKLPKFDHNI